MAFVNRGCVVKNPARKGGVLYDEHDLFIVLNRTDDPVDMIFTGELLHALGTRIVS